MDLIAIAWVIGAVLVAALMGYHQLMDGVPLRLHRAEFSQRLATRRASALAVAAGVLVFNLVLVAVTRLAN